MKILAVAVSIALALVAGAAQAAQANAVLPVSASVVNSCQVTAVPLNFGAFDPISFQTTLARTAVVVTCTSGTPYAIGMDGGQSGSISARQMVGAGTDRLDYALYSDPSLTSNWGDISGNDVSGIGSGQSQYLGVYGQIPGGQNFVPAGSYSDTVMVTVTY